jgi:hypothetical protein
VIEFSESNHVTTATATIAVEQVLVGVNEKAGLVVSVQRTQSQKAAEADRPSLLPIVCLQILQYRNLPFQFIESHSIHGLRASIGRIWQSAPRSQARMVGVRRKSSQWAPTLIQHHKLSSRSCAHRRTVEGSGKRVGSLQ